MTKTIGYGSALSVTTTTGETLIAQIRSISGPGVQADDVDTTTLDSSSNYRTFAAGLLNAGEVTAQLVYDPSNLTHQRLNTYMNARSSKTFKAYHGSTTGVAETFTAYVKGMGREIPLDDLITCDATFKVSGSAGYSTTS